MPETPWQHLPLVVRRRLRLWFHPEGDEKLVAYIPDRNRGRTQDGIAGLAISDQRLVYHTPILDEQAPVSEPGTIPSR